MIFPCPWANEWLWHGHCPGSVIYVHISHHEDSYLLKQANMAADNIRLITIHDHMTEDIEIYKIQSSFKNVAFSTKPEWENFFGGP